MPRKYVHHGNPSVCSIFIQGTKHLHSTCLCSHVPLWPSPSNTHNEFSKTYLVRDFTIRFGFSMELNLKECHEGYHTLSQLPQSMGHSQLITAEKKKATPSGGTSQSRDKLLAKRRSKAMSIATKPGQQILMNAFMMYMSGSTLNIFSISITSMAILTPLTSLFTIDSAFASLELDTNMPKLVYAACNLAWLALGLYKMSSMRLLPTTSADWTDSIVWKDMMETSSIPPPIP